MKFSVICPVVNPGLANEMIRSVEANTLLPNEMIVLANTDDGGFSPISSLFDITILDSKTSVGVNESWSIGFECVSMDADAVCVFNDDIVLGLQYFERVKRVFEHNPDCSVCCPRTVDDIDQLIDFDINDHDISGMKKREGWAFSIRADILKKLPPIPHEIIKTFYGDDWIWFWTVKIGHMPWLMDRNNLVFHYGSTSVNSRGLMKHHRAEKNAYVEYVESLTQRKGIELGMGLDEAIRRLKS